MQHLIPAYYSFYRPRKDERLSWPSWLTSSGWLTHNSGHPSAAGRAQDRESSPARDRRSTTVPRHELPTGIPPQYHYVLSDSLKPISFGYRTPPIRFSQAGGQSAHKARPPNLELALTPLRRALTDHVTRSLYVNITRARAPRCTVTAHYY